MPLAALIVAYLASIVAGVWAVEAIGVVPVAPGIYAPAAVYVVGITLVLRDLTQEKLEDHLGRTRDMWWAMNALIVAGVLLSAAVNPTLAAASGIAFLASETVDFAVYLKLRNRGASIAGAIGGSNAASIAVDSLLFLGIAFGSLEFLPGQIIGKAIATFAAILALVLIRGRRVVTA